MAFRLETLQFLGLVVRFFETALLLVVVVVDPGSVGTVFEMGLAEAFHFLVELGEDNAGPLVLLGLVVPVPPHLD